MSVSSDMELLNKNGLRYLVWLAFVGVFSFLIPVSLLGIAVSLLDYFHVGKPPSFVVFPAVFAVYIAWRVSLKYGIYHYPKWAAKNAGSTD